MKIIKFISDLWGASPFWASVIFVWLAIWVICFVVSIVGVIQLILK